MGIFKKINFGLRKTRNNVSGAIDNVLDSYTSIDQELFDELEEALVMLPFHLLPVLALPCATYLHYRSTK